MATEEVLLKMCEQQDLPNWSNESVDDRLNMVRYLIIDGVLLATDVKMQLSPDLAKSS